MTQAEEAAVALLLLELELRLMDPAFRKDRSEVSALLAEDFREFGSSGRVWSREAILDELATETAYAAPVVEDFALRILAPAIALVTYRTVRPDCAVTSLRSSLWIDRTQGWQVLFHQGTKIPAQ